MTIETGNLEQAFAKVETSYNVPSRDVLSATDGIRHLNLSLTSKKNREASPEKRGTPDEQQSLPRRQSQSFNLANIMWEPSGTLGTVSNVAKFLKAGFGSQTSPTLNTTVASGGAPTGAVLTSVTGLAVGDIVVVTLPSGVRECTRIKSITVATVTWDPIGGTPANGAAVISGVNFKLASNLTESLAVYKYFTAGGFKQAVYGSVVDQIEAMFDGTKEVTLALQGPSAQYEDSTTGSAPQAKPGSHTTVGNPASGLVGNVAIDAVAFPVISAKITINNAIELRNKELGTSYASGIAGRTTRRKVGITLTVFLEDTTLFTKANAVTKCVVRLLVGDTNGAMVAAVLPSVEFEIPDVPDSEGPMELTITGVGYAVSGNDAVVFGEL